MSPVEELNNKFETLLQRLPSGWEELAVESHAFTRARQIKSPKERLARGFFLRRRRLQSTGGRRSSDSRTDMDFRSRCPCAIGEMRDMVGNSAGTTAL